MPPYKSRLLSGDQTIELPWLASTSKSCRQEAGGMDAGERLVQRPFVWSDFEREKMFPRRRKRLGGIGHAFAQVQQKATIFRIQAGQKMRGVLGREVGDASLRFGQIRIVGLLDVANDPAVEALDAGVAGELDALTGGNAAQQTFALDVANQRRQEREIDRARPCIARERSWGH